MSRYQPLHSFVVGGAPNSFIVSAPVPRAFVTPTMPTFNEYTTGLDVVNTFPERVKGKTCMLPTYYIPLQCLISFANLRSCHYRPKLAIYRRPNSSGSRHRSSEGTHSRVSETVNSHSYNRKDPIN
jgi:hypothetical protein